MAATGGNDPGYNKTTCNISSVAGLVEAGCVTSMNQQRIISAIARKARNIPDPKTYLIGLPFPELGFPRNILLFRRSPRRYPTRIPIIHEDKYLLIMTLYGKGTAIINDIAFHLNPREALLVFPHQFHHFSNLEENDFLWLFCSFSISHSQAIVALKNTPCAIGAKLWPALRQLVDEYQEGAVGHSYRLASISMHLWLILLGLAEGTAVASPARRTATDHPRQDLEFLERLQTYLIDRLHTAIRLSELARFMGMSRRSLAMRFQAIMRLTLADYIQALRYKKACSLMSSSDLNMSEIAAQTGYGSLFSFSRAFKRMTGKPPSKFRAKHSLRSR